MMPLEFARRAPRHRLGLKGPRAQGWLAAGGIAVPTTPNTWVWGNSGAPKASAAAAAPVASSAPIATAASWSPIASSAPMAAAAEVAEVAEAAAAADIVADDRLLVARLGSAEFFLEDPRAGVVVRELVHDLYETPPAGVYPVLREDAAFHLSGDGSFDVLAQVCSIDFANLAFESQPVIMTLMIGVSVLVLPQAQGDWRRFRIWCDPTFGDYLGESLGGVVVECGGRYRPETEESNESG